MEAILIIGSDHCELSVFHFLLNFDFCDTSNEILMVVKFICRGKFT